MRSNIARTCPSGSVPERAAAEGISPRSRSGAVAAFGTLPDVPAATLLALSPRTVACLLTAQRGEEVHEVLLLLIGQAGEGRHRRGRILERAFDGPRQQLVADVGQLRARAAVAVLADLVAGEAARLRHHELAGLEVRRDL